MHRSSGYIHSQAERIGLSKVGVCRAIYSGRFEPYGGRRERGGFVPVRSSTPIRRGDFRMRGTLLAMLIAAGIGVIGTAGGASAAPINGAAIGAAADQTGAVETVQHWRWGSGGHRRWGSGGGGHWR